MNNRMAALVCAALVVGALPAWSDDAAFSAQVQDVSAMTVAPEAQLAGYMGVNEDSSWSEISRKGLYAAFPKVFWSGTFYGVNGLCKRGEALETVGADRRCVRWHHGNHNDRCLEWSTEPVAIPIVSKAQRCEQWRRSRDQDACVRWETYERVIPLSYEVPVVANHNREHGERVVFKKSFTIPACR